MSDFSTRKPNLASEFNREFFDEKNTQGLTAYTFIYRFQDDDDFSWKSSGRYTHPATILEFNPTTPKKYFLKIITQNPSIIIYHDRTYASSKNCSERPHFHVIIWAKQHPSSQYAFSKLKEYMKSISAKHQYEMTCPMVFKPDGLVEYFQKGEVDRQLLCTNDITTNSQKLFMEKLTSLTFKINIQKDEHYKINTATDTVRQNKFAFIKTLMKQAAATDQGQIMKFVYNSNDQKMKREWNVTYRSTPNIKALIVDAAAEINSETWIQPIWQQIAEKKKCY